MREFTPPVRTSALRIVVAVALPLIVLVPLGALLAMVLGMTQITYTVGDGALVVQSGDLFAGQRRVQLADIVEARVVTARGGRRSSGTALPGYCTGRFSYPELGLVWQATNCGARGVLVDAGDRPILITPPDPEGFVQAIHAGAPTSVTLPPPDKGPLRAIVLIAGSLVVVTSLMVSALMFLGPSRMRYLVGEGTFEVRTLFGSQRWPTAGARARAYTPSKLRRVAGTAAPGYFTGRYRESGQATRVYATEVDRVVLFEGVDRVLVSPEDRVAFLRALEEEGVTVEHHA